MAEHEVEDLATLSSLNEEILLKALKERYVRDKIYTYVGDILVAVNPFKDVGVYGKETSSQYKNAKRGTLPPHIFAVSDIAYQAMMGLHGSQAKNQCILISGESGAGKTESTKLIIKQLIEICKGNTQLEQQILQVNPLLEAFGNAQTMMNDNSSRFGKYIQLKFRNGHVMGGKISEYLLEKSRLIAQGSGEENFHIFYYLFAGLTPEQQQKFKLKTAKDYSYFSDGAKSMNSKKPGQLKREYEELQNAMDMVGFADEEQELMFAVLSAVLTLGNVQITANDNGEAVIPDPSALKSAAQLLGLDPAELQDCLTCSVTFTAGEEIKRNYSKSLAEDSRDAVAKTIYGRLFSWIVHKINTLLAPQEEYDPEEIQEIGILDIFGFENLQRNSFEQACINLANEQLQFFFNKHIFMLEQEEYKREGVDWKEIKFIDNQPLLDFILGRPIGLLALLDEESQFPKGSDQSFVDKLTYRFGDNPMYVKPAHSQTAVFKIIHYAGKVQYEAEGWLEKNRDTIPPGAMSLLQRCDNSLVSLIFKGKISRTGTLALNHLSSKKSTKRRIQQQARVAKERKLTVGHQFKNSLQVLMERMTTSQPVFIRCIKPNSLKKPKEFQDDYVNAQLLYTGMLETTKIRREGFAVRPSFAEFVERYKIIIQQPKADPTVENCRRIMKASKVEGFHVGKTKVFMKYNHVERLAEIMEEMGKKVVHIQKIVRGFNDRCKVNKLKIEATRQEEEMNMLLIQIENFGLNFTQTQAKVLEDDVLQPKEFGKKKQASVTSYVEPIATEAPEASENGVQEEVVEEEEGEDEESDEEVPEDTFRPSMKKVHFGKAGTKQASVRWFKETQKEQVQLPSGQFAEWFHGIITRREAERLLKHTAMGCFIIRVSESRFGYSLSFRAEERSRHYMISQTPTGKYIILGEPKVHRSLQSMVEYLRQNKLSNWDHVLTIACGQERGQCNYSELVTGDDMVYCEVYGDDQRGLERHYLTLQPNPSMMSSTSSTGTLPPPLPDRHYSFAKRVGETPSAVRDRPVPKPQGTDLAYQQLLQAQKEQNSGNEQGARKSRMSTARAKLPNH